MRRRRLPPALPPSAWGLDAAPDGALCVQGVSTVDLAGRYGTPLHVVNEPRLESTARAFRRAFEDAWPEGRVSVHYALKCNGVPAVAGAIRRAGLGVEVMSPFELVLAQRLGWSGDDIVVNGPCKPRAFLEACVDAQVRLVVIDALEELDALDALCRRRGATTDVLLRVNPDYVPRGMNAGSATGSRKGCAFGLDLQGGEVEVALARLSSRPALRFRGYHFHIGTGIHDPADYTRALGCLDRLLDLATRAGVGEIDVLDVGGGFASPTTRELVTREMLLYQGLGRFPRMHAVEDAPDFDDFARAVANGVRRRWRGAPPPELLVEPGRAIASPNQLLLLGVERVKTRAGARTWLVTDGGLGTVSMPTYYEVHEVLLADDVRRPRTGRATVIGPVCFAGDVVYRNQPLPDVRPGEVLAVMDSGAYFTALESSFGFPRPAVATVSDGRARLVRRRETFDDMLSRDVFSPTAKHLTEQEIQR